MPTHTPRSGSMQFWPRVRARRSYPRIRVSSVPKDAKPAAFAGYKVGMTHILITDNRKNSPTKGSEVSWPVTIIECPPIKIMGVRLIKNAYQAKEITSDIIPQKQEKEVLKKTALPKKSNSLDDIKAEEFDNLKLIVHTEPKKTGIGKKIPEIFEISLGGKKEDKLAFAKANIGKELKIQDIFKEGVQLNLHGVTKGKGYQGSVKRFGIDIRRHKSEKTKRGPGSLGGWKGQGHVMYRVAYASKMGFHQRTEFNKQILKISDLPDQINIKGGFKHYGNVKNTYILIKGSVVGAAKRLVIMTESKRKNPHVSHDVPTIEQISLESKQGR